VTIWPFASRAQNRRSECNIAHAISHHILYAVRSSAKNTAFLPSWQEKHSQRSPAHRWRIRSPADQTSQTSFDHLTVVESMQSATGSRGWKVCFWTTLPRIIQSLRNIPLGEISYLRWKSVIASEQTDHKRRQSTKVDGFRKPANCWHPF
jgi:hypothetical protein